MNPLSTTSITLSLLWWISALLLSGGGTITEGTALAFVVHPHPQRRQQQNVNRLVRIPKRNPWIHNHHTPLLVTATPTNTHEEEGETDSAASTSASTTADAEIVDRSTLTLLEHINFNVPSHEFAVPFYYDILGCGFDPRMADNWKGADDDDDSKPQAGSTIWANCGASQFHLCYNATEPTLQGRIGLRYQPKALQELEHRLEEHQSTSSSTSCCFQSYTKEKDSRGNPQLTVTDRYNNDFVCQTGLHPHADASVECLKQPIVTHVDHFMPSLNPPDSETEFWDTLASRFGREESSECDGITFVEMDCPRGTAEQIATFYESVFDATTSVIPMQEHKIAMIAFGNVDEFGRADQCLLFKEQSTTPIQNTGHHIAMYVGETEADFEQAYQNAEMAGVIWINPRFADKVDTLSAAKDEKQFRFKDIVDLATGECIMELEHEIRSIEHPSFPAAAHNP